MTRALLLSASLLGGMGAAMAQDSAPPTGHQLVSQDAAFDRAQNQYAQTRPTRSRARTAPAAAQSPPMSEAALGERMNANTIAVVSGTPGGTYFRMASDGPEWQ